MCPLIARCRKTRDTLATHVWPYIKNGKDLPVGFGNVQIVNTTKLTLTSVYPPMYDIASGTYKFLDEQATFECTKD